MSHNIFVSLFLLFLLIVFVAATFQSYTEFFVEVEPIIELNGNLYYYVYKINNIVKNGHDGDPERFFSFSVGVPRSANILNVNVPAGWKVEYAWRGEWISWVVEDFDQSIMPGNQLSFGFASNFPPGDSVYVVTASRQHGLIDGLNVDQVSGITYAPSAPIHINKKN